MKKPLLIDFGLTEEDLNRNKKETEAYYSFLKENEERVDNIIKKINIIVSIICLVLFLVSLSEGFDPNILSVVLLVMFINFGITTFVSVSNAACNKDRGKIIFKRMVNQKVNSNIEAYTLENYVYQGYQLSLSKKYWMDMTGYDFEKEIAKLYQKQGYRAYVTRATGDGGVDIILSKENKRIAVQCKHHNRPVGPNDVRALQGVVASQKYDYGIFVSLSGFTPYVKNEINNSSIKIVLVELDRIIEMAK